MALPKVGVEAVIEGMSKFEADSRKVNKSLVDIGDSTSRLGSVASGVTSKITSLGTSLLKIGAATATTTIIALVAGLAKAATSGLSFNNAMEQASAKINAFTKDASLTAKILEDVRMEAAKTPFEFEAMANAVSGLLPAAKQADVAIMDLLRDAEVLAASNPAEGLEGAAFALREAVSGDFTSVIERFNLPRSMINQLKAEGLPALEVVRTAMREMGYDMDLVTALANTAEGRWSTFKDTLTNVAGTISQPIFNALSSGLGGVNDWLTLINPQLEAFANMMAGQISGAIAAVTVSVNKIAEAFQRFGARGAAISFLGQIGLDQSQIGVVLSITDAISSLYEIGRLLFTGDFRGGGRIFGLEEDDPIISTLFTIRNTVISVVDEVTQSIGKVQQAFQRFGVKGAAVSILGQLGMSPEMIGEIRTTIDSVSTAITESFDKIMGAYDRFGARGAAVSILGQLGIDPETIGLVRTTFDTIVEKIGILQQIYTEFGAMGAGISLLSILGLSSESIALITTGVQSIIDTFTALSTWWTTNWPIMQAVALTAWEVIKGIFAGVQAALGPALAQLQTRFAELGATLSGLGISWAEVWNAIKTATTVVLTVIGALILGAIGVITGLVSATASAISTIISVWQSLMTQVTTLLTGITQSIFGVTQVWKGIISGDWGQIWQGLVLMVTGAINQIKGLIGVLLTLFTGPFAVILETVKGFVNGFLGFFQGMYDDLVGGSIIPDMINDIVTWFKSLPKKITSALTNLAKIVIKPFEDSYDAVKEAWNPEKWMQLGSDAIDGLLEGLKSNAAAVLEFLKNLAIDSLQGLGQFWGAESPATEFMPLGASAIQGLLLGAKNEGFAKKFVDDLDMGGIARELGTGGSGWKELRRIIGRGVSANFDALMQGDLSPAQVIQQIQDTAARFNFPPSFVSEFAKANGLIDHLNSKVSEFQQQMRMENLGKMLQIGGAASGLGSTFADMLREQAGDPTQAKEQADKLIEGNQKLTDELGTQENQLATLKQELEALTRGEGVNQIAVDKKRLAIEKATESLGFGERQLAIYRQELATLMLDEEGNALQIEKKNLQIDKQVESLDAQQKGLVTLQQELEKLTVANQVDIAVIEKKQQAIAALNLEMGKNAAAIIKTEAELRKLANTPAGRIEFFKAFLEGKVKGKQVFNPFLNAMEEMLVFEQGGLEVSSNRASVQRQLNALLAEQAKQEALITQQKEAQQKLGFLQAQLDLIKLGKDLGGNIFRGIKFGLDASVTDLLAATNNVVEAMIGQINADLQIASPSKVMANIGRQMMAGLQGGIASMTPVLSSQMSASVAGPLSPAMAGALSSGATSNTYNSFNMGGNNINSGIDAAQFEARVLQVIRRNL